VKRAEALRALSRDHHQALGVALRLRRADANTAAEAQRGFLDFWREHGSGHFGAEEEVLLPTFADHGDPEHPSVGLVLRQHAEIRRAALTLGRRDASAAELNELGQLLDDHVRLEERQLFPLIEDALDEAQLAQLAEALAEAEERRQAV
jgi:hemerythrin-like domain-containing protein